MTLTDADLDRVLAAADTADTKGNAGHAARLRDLVADFLDEVHFGRKQVHIETQDGTTIYDRLWDDGTHLYRFDSEDGFVDTALIRAWSYVVKPGWEG